MLAEDAIKSAISNYYTKNPAARTTNLGGTSASMPKIDMQNISEPSAPSPTAWFQPPKRFRVGDIGVLCLINFRWSSAFFSSGCLMCRKKAHLDNSIWKARMGSLWELYENHCGKWKHTDGHPTCLFPADKGWDYCSEYSTKPLYENTNVQTPKSFWSDLIVYPWCPRPSFAPPRESRRCFLLNWPGREERFGFGLANAEKPTYHQTLLTNTTLVLYLPRVVSLCEIPASSLLIAQG